MNISKEILKDERIMLPIEYSDVRCNDAMKNILTEYKELLCCYNCSRDLVENVEKFCCKIENMYNEYYLGHQNKAYQVFKDAIEYQIKDIGIIASVLPNESLYRARKNEGSQDYKNEEMFHIKYEMRGKVQTQRFSFPGLPCLYLGTSSYVCWLELNRPQFDQIQLATIRQKDVNEEFRVIDLCIHPLTYYKELEEIEKGNETEHKGIELEQYLKWWPIMAACSVSVKNEEDSFKPEYVFPQFMLQYLLEEMDNCIGIKYISIKAGKISKKQYESDYRTYTNYVIPIRTLTETEKGFCKFLESSFAIVRNYSGRELQVHTDIIRENGVKWTKFGQEEIKHPLDKAKIFGTNDMSYPYSKSIFRRMELVLENEDMNKYSDDGKLIISPISNEEIERLFM